MKVCDTKGCKKQALVTIKNRKLCIKCYKAEPVVRWVSFNLTSYILYTL